MTRRTQSKKKVRTQHSQSFKDEALGLAEKVGVARDAVDLGLHDSQLYNRRQKATLRRSQSDAERSRATEIAHLRWSIESAMDRPVVISEAGRNAVRSRFSSSRTLSELLGQTGRITRQ